mgnify:CR=1 FL=1
MTTYPKRLIEVDLPIKRISEHARREKSIRHGHISTLHIWWARRPLAACRAVICAALWPDPAQEDCPAKFREDAAAIMARFWNPIGRTDLDYNEPLALRRALLDFIADFSNWDNSTKKEYLETARALTQSAHEALGGTAGTRPLVVDPFAGGGSIPLEALRVGADAFASDLNPVAVLLNKVVLEYIPRYGQKLADEVRRSGEWIRAEAEKELGRFYPKDPDGATPIAYLWARTITCEGPGCGAEVPLMRSLWLARKAHRSMALKFVLDRERKRIDFEIIPEARAGDVGEGTVRRGSATCPVCGYTTPVVSVRKQLRARRGGAADARLFCVVTTKPGQQGRFYRLPAERDLEAVQAAAEELERRKAEHTGPLSLVPDEPVNPLPHSVNRLPIYGMVTWGEVFTKRQILALTTLSRLVGEAERRLTAEYDAGMAVAVKVCLAMAVDRLSDRCSTLCTWDPSPAASGILHTFSRQALPFVWDFAEGMPLEIKSGGWLPALEWISLVINREAEDGKYERFSNVQQASANLSPLSDDAAQVFFTDPPYYDMICYADLSDFFHVWLRRSLENEYCKNWISNSTPKMEEIIVEPTPVENVGIKDEWFYLERMTKALAEGRRVLRPDGLGVIVFAHKSTTGWEALLQSLIDSGWMVTGSWPIDTEMATKVAGIGQSRLMSSIHLVCRPREHPSGEVRTDDVGDWSEVLSELPQRIHAWLPGLAAQGVVGADAIFSCLGPALEIYSCHSRVEKASGDVVTLKEYLEEVWAAVSREALSMIFEGADSTGFEEDARLTAMWLWTLSASGNANSTDGSGDDLAEEGGPEDQPARRLSGYVLEYDAARKIAQGLGCHLENLAPLVEVKGDKARLLPVSERAGHLFGSARAKPMKRKKKASPQMVFQEGRVVREAAGEEAGLAAPSLGKTTLDRLHQAMLLFAEGRGEALKRFITEEIGKDQGLWSLAQSLSALYPPGSEERRWVEGVLTRKKSLGL